MSDPCNDVPLLFIFSERLCSEESLLSVSGVGRALLVRDADERPWRMLGVEPCGVGGWGETPQQAHLKFAVALGTELVAIAERVQPLDALVGALSAFFHDVSAERQARWATLAQSIWRGQQRLESPFDTLPTISSALPCRILVQKMHLDGFSSVLSTNQPFLAQTA